MRGREEEWNKNLILLSSCPTSLFPGRDRRGQREIRADLSLCSVRVLKVEKIISKEGAGAVIPWWPGSEQHQERRRETDLFLTKSKHQSIHYYLSWTHHTDLMTDSLAGPRWGQETTIASTSWLYHIRSGKQIRLSRIIASKIISEQYIKCIEMFCS